MANVGQQLAKQIQQALALTKSAISTWHGRFVLAGLLVGLIYLPTWSTQLFLRSFLHGSTVLILILVITGLAFHRLWAQRQMLSQQLATEEDQLIGHVLIACCLILFLLCQFAVWAQAIVWLIILMGLFISTWGMEFFLRHPLPPLLLAATVYPHPGFIAHTLWQTFTPHQFLERLMAQAGAAGLRMIGQPAISQGTFLAIPPTGAVHVDWGCNGFTMAVQMAIAGFLMGIFLKQNWVNTGLMITVGSLLALVFNVPRIMLLTLASVYWGESWFKFWHGTWGGQIFTGLLFTLYYYAIMWMVNRRPKKVV